MLTMFIFIFCNAGINNMIFIGTIAVFACAL